MEEGRQPLEELERDGEALMERYAGALPEALENLAPDERHRVYKMLRLKVVVRADAPVEVTGVFTEPLGADGLRSVKTEGTSMYVRTGARS